MVSFKTSIMFGLLGLVVVLVQATDKEGNLRTAANLRRGLQLSQEEELDSNEPPLDNEQGELDFHPQEEEEGEEDYDDGEDHLVGRRQLKKNKLISCFGIWCSFEYRVEDWQGYDTGKRVCRQNWGSRPNSSWDVTSKGYDVVRLKSTQQKKKKCSARPCDKEWIWVPFQKYWYCGENTNESDPFSGGRDWNLRDENGIVVHVNSDKVITDDCCWVTNTCNDRHKYFWWNALGIRCPDP
jgi:hypothetical protein